MIGGGKNYKLGMEKGGGKLWEQNDITKKEIKKPMGNLELGNCIFNLKIKIFLLGELASRGDEEVSPFLGELCY